MKIWVALTETDSGNDISYFYSEADAERFALDFCEVRWNEVLDPMQDNWQEAYETLTADPAYMDWLHMHDMDISGHPALLAAREELKHILTTGRPTSAYHAAEIILDLGGKRVEHEQ